MIPRLSKVDLLKKATLLILIYHGYEFTTGCQIQLLHWTNWRFALQTEVTSFWGCQQQFSDEQHRLQTLIKLR